MHDKRQSATNRRQPLQPLNHDLNPFTPFVKCGKVFTPVLPLSLTRKEPPLPLTKVEVFVKERVQTNILINFSGFITSVLRGEASFNNLVFQLIRSCSHKRSILRREYPFQRQLLNDTTIKEPLVYNFCDENPPIQTTCTYTLQLVKADLSPDSYYDITQKSMTALVFAAGRKEDPYE
ncbi:DUF4489 domain-containing protein [Alkalihalobacillus macyae]|uniref:DUF4489 domain-containing protein n=1 Tax=Guptibacillus hwajinpoensis TaxID=208199 RepID=UPI00273B4841|nr:DUF4489 domain-containing protein [Alkalihalobacillus macyae]MDP4549589.1 DUF4489 domain-containing protein [Alkalihalobacillus macyae]